MRGIPLSLEQRDAGDSRCQGMRWLEGLSARRVPAVRGRGMPLAGSEGCGMPGEALSLPARGRSGWSCCFPRVPSPGKGSSPRVPAPHTMTEDLGRGLSAVKFRVSSPSPFPLARAGTARCQKSCRWFFPPAETSHLFWGIINPFGVPAFSCQRSPNAVSEGLSLPMCCQLGDGQQTLSLLSNIHPAHPENPKR